MLIHVWDAWNIELTLTKNGQHPSWKALERIKITKIRIECKQQDEWSDGPLGTPTHLRNNSLYVYIIISIENSIVQNET